MNLNRINQKQSQVLILMSNSPDGYLGGLCSNSKYFFQFNQLSNTNDLDLI